MNYIRDGQHTARVLDTVHKTKNSGNRRALSYKQNNAERASLRYFIKTFTNKLLFLFVSKVCYLFYIYFIVHLL